jgi:hypothetical protein
MQDADAADASDYDPEAEDFGSSRKQRRKQPRKRAARKALNAAYGDGAAAPASRAGAKPRSRLATAAEPDVQPLAADDGARPYCACVDAKGEKHPRRSHGYVVCAVIGVGPPVFPFGLKVLPAKHMVHMSAPSLCMQMTKLAVGTLCLRAQQQQQRRRRQRRQTPLA